MRDLMDEKLVELLLQGQDQALDELYARYARKLYLFFSNREDLVHDVFLRVIQSIPQFDPQKASFRTWLFRIAKNRSIDLLRRDWKRKTVSLEEERIDRNPGVEEKAIQNDLIAAVRECLKGLDKPEEREALVLYYLEDKLFREIASIFERSVSLAQKWVAAGREKMKRCLEKKGVDE